MKFEKELAEASAWLSVHQHVACHTVVGSALYRDDAQDLDILVMLNEDYPDGIGLWVGEEIGEGWSGSNYDTDGSWIAVRKDNVNLIVTDDLEVYTKYNAASQVCMALSLPTKAQRMIVYRIVRDGMNAKTASLVVAAELDPFGMFA